MITSLQITNFKSWLDTGQIKLSNISGIFGTNSSGKSSILQFLLMLKETVESQDRAQVLDFGGDAERNYVNLGSFRDVLHKGNSAQADSLSFEITWTLPENLTIYNPISNKEILFTIESLSFSAEVNQSNVGPIVNQFVYRFTYKNNTYTFGMKLLEDDAYYLISNGYTFQPLQDDSLMWTPIKFYGFPNQLYTMYQNAGFLNKFNAAFESLIESLYYLAPLREYPKRQYIWGGSKPSDLGRRGEYVVNALLASRSMSRIRRGKGIGNSFTVEQYVGYWLKELGLVEDFSVKRIAPDKNSYELLIRQFNSSSEVLISEVGFGVSQVLPVLAICYYVPEGSTILLEQPEIHLHPSVQAGLADVFIDAVKKRNIQIILESHSEHLLLRLQRRMSEETIAPEKITLSFCERKENESINVPLHLDKFGNITNWPTGFFGDEFHERAEMMKNIARRMEADQQ